MLRRNEKSASPSRRPLSPPNILHPRNPLFKSKPENNYPLNNNNNGKEGGIGVGGGGVASRISQSTSGLNCLMNNGQLDNGSGGGGGKQQALSGWRSDPRLCDSSNGPNFAIRNVS